MFLEPLYLSLKLAFLTTAVLLLLGVPVAAWLASTNVKCKPIIESIICLPLVLPPSVLGFYFLQLFAMNSPIGYYIYHLFDYRIVFSFGGLVIASVIYSLPFMIHPVHSGLQNLSPSLKDAAYTLGASPLKTFFRILLPNIKSALFTGVVLTFAHTVGEFGVILMIGGNIPGVTRVASIAIYDEVERMNYGNAHLYAGVLLAVSFVILLILFVYNKSHKFRSGYVGN